MTRSRRDGHRRRVALAAVIPVLGLAFAASVAALGRAASPTRLVLEQGWLAPGSGHPFGSGDAGVDLLALASHATLRALALALVVAVFGFVVGTALGAFVGLRGGAAERWVLRLCDLVQAFPSFLLALAVLSAVSRPTRIHVGLVFCLTVWAQFARLSAAQSRILRASQFVEAARALGMTELRILLHHVVPNLLGPVAVQVGTAAAGVVLGETALGFVGLGPADGVSLGALLEQGTLAMLRAPHVLAVGALAVALLTGSLQLASEGLRRWVQVS